MYKSALLSDGISVRVLCTCARSTPQDAAVLVLAAATASVLVTEWSHRSVSLYAFMIIIFTNSR